MSTTDDAAQLSAIQSELSQLRTRPSTDSPRPRESTPPSCLSLSLCSCLLPLARESRPPERSLLLRWGAHETATAVARVTITPACAVCRGGAGRREWRRPVALRLGHQPVRLRPPPTHTRTALLLRTPPPPRPACACARTREWLPDRKRRTPTPRAAHRVIKTLTGQHLNVRCGGGGTVRDLKETVAAQAVSPRQPARPSSREHAARSPSVP